MKSLVFKEEIDFILDLIKEYFEFEAKKRDKKYLKFYKFLTLQFQAYIIFGFYTGLRLNELRTRTHSDIIEEPFYIYDSRITKNVFSINVNKKGLKGIQKINSFKSSNATRRVCFEIRNDVHAEIFKDFIQKSMSYGSRYLFKEYEYKNSKISKKVLKLSKLSFLNELIQNITHRYTSLHSLRHSYATYWLLDRINSDENFNDIIMNFSIEIGHVTPQVTFQNYIHYELIEELNYDNKL
jgi:integrase